MADPFNLVDERSTEASSPLMWIVADAVGASTMRAVAMLHVAFLALCFAASVIAVRRWLSDFAARLFVVAWFASPLANIQITWIGKPDPGTILGAVLVTIGPRWACVAGGLLLGFNHFEQGVLIGVAASAVRIGVRRESWGTIAPIAAAIAVGKLVLMLYQDVAGAHLSRGAYVDKWGVGRFVDMWAPNIPTLLFSVLGVLWLPVAVMWWQSGLRTRWALAAAFVIVTGPVLLTVDLTRVFALVTFPILVAAVEWWSHPLRRLEVVRWLPWLIVAAIVVPRVIMWDHTVYVSSW